MSQINRIHIKGFKSIFDAELDLGKLNVFVGTNGAGKSNFLEAIAMLSASIEGGVDHERLARRGARLSSHAVFRSAFKHKKRKPWLSMEADINDLTYKMQLHSIDKFTYHSESLKHEEKIIAGRSGSGTKVLGSSIKKLENTSSILSVFRAFETTKEIEDSLNAIQNYSIYAPSTPILRGVAQDGSVKSPLGLYGGNLATAINEIISEKEPEKKRDIFRFFELLDWFQTLGTTSKIDSDLISEHVSFGKLILKFKDKYMKANFNQLYAYDVSEGALYILFVIALLIHQKGPDIFALDNVDNALNPGLITQLMSNINELVKSKNKQVFMTTHNPTTLDGIDLFDPDHRLFIVQRDKDGQTEFKQIKPPEGYTKENWEEEHFGLKLSEIWLSGALGALPTKF